MKRTTLILATLSLLAVASASLYEALLSDETRIRRRITAQIEAFNAADPECLAGLHDDFVDRTSGVGRRDLQLALRFLFSRDVEADSGRFGWRADLAPESLSITDIDPDAGTAAATLRLTLYRGLDDAEKAVWEIAVDGELARTEQGWQFRESTHATLSGRRPRR